MNKVWEELCTGDCGISINPGSQLDRELLQQSRLITQKMDLLEESLASVQSSVSSLHRSEKCQDLNKILSLSQVAANLCEV